MGINLVLGWVLCLALLLTDAAKATPLIVGDGRDQMTASDVADLCALAGATMPPGEPVLIRAVLSGKDGHTPTLSGAVVNFAPSEANTRYYRWRYLLCYPAASHRPGDEHQRSWREAGKWKAPGRTASGEYMIFAPSDKELPEFTLEHLSNYTPTHVVSELDTQSILGLRNAARTSRLQRHDGPELSCAPLAITAIFAPAIDGAPNSASVAFRSPDVMEIYVTLSQDQRKTWHVIRVEPYMYQ